MKNNLTKKLSIGLSSLLVLLTVVSVVPTHNKEISIKNPTHGVSPLEDPPWEMIN
jgi:hypothetical protein